MKTVRGGTPTTRRSLAGERVRKARAHLTSALRHYRMANGLASVVPRAKPSPDDLKVADHIQHVSASIVLRARQIATCAKATAKICGQEGQSS